MYWSTGLAWFFTGPPALLSLHYALELLVLSCFEATCLLCTVRMSSPHLGSTLRRTWSVTERWGTEWRATRRRRRATIQVCVLTTTPG